MTWRCGYVLKRVGQNLLQTRSPLDSLQNSVNYWLHDFYARASFPSLERCAMQNRVCSSTTLDARATVQFSAKLLGAWFLRSSDLPSLERTSRILKFSKLCLKFKLDIQSSKTQKHGKTLYNLKTFPIWIRLLKIMSNSQTQNLKLHTMIHVCIKLSLCPFKTCLSGIRRTNTWGIHQVGVWKCHACKNLMNSNSKYACMYPIQLYSSISWYS